MADPTDLANPQVALNALDGFSTTEAITTGFNQPLNPDSLQIGESVRVFEISADRDADTTGVVRSRSRD